MTEITGTIATAGENFSFEDFRNDKGAEILVTGKNFKIANSTENIITKLRKAGIRCLIGIGFNREIFRKAINKGLAVIEVDILDKVEDNDSITVRLNEGRIIASGTETTFPPYPEYVLHIIEAGDIIKAVKKELGKK